MQGVVVSFEMSSSSSFSSSCSLLDAFDRPIAAGFCGQAVNKFDHLIGEEEEEEKKNLLFSSLGGYEHVRGDYLKTRF